MRWLLWVLSGCVLPGLDGVDEPEGTRIVGQVSWSELSGGYWPDGATDAGSAWWGLLDEAQNDRSAGDLVVQGAAGCHRGQVDTTWLTDNLAEVGGSSTLVGGDRLELPWDADLRLFSAPDLAQRPSGAYALGAIETSEGTFSVPGTFVDTVSPLDYDTALLDQTERQSKTAAELSFDWEPRPSETELAVITVILLDGTGAEVERVVCVVSAGDGHLDVPVDLWQGLDAGVSWSVHLGVMRETVADIDGAPTGAASRMLYTAAITGAINKKD